MRNERAKRAESLEAVTHTHTHTHTFIQVYRRIGGQSGESLNLKNIMIKNQDGLRKVGCLFRLRDTS